MKGTEVSVEQLSSVGLVHGAGPDGGRGRQWLVKLVAGHRGDGGAGLGAAGWSHQVPHHLGTVRSVTGFAVLLDNTGNDKYKDEDNNDAKRYDQNQYGG